MARVYKMNKNVFYNNTFFLIFRNFKRIGVRVLKKISNVPANATKQ